MRESRVRLARSTKVFVALERDLAEEQIVERLLGELGSGGLGQGERRGRAEKEREGDLQDFWHRG
jgi:hypothetical protein